MSRALTERRLFDTAARLRSAREELAVLDAQLAEVADTAEDARMRSLVSETPLAHREHADAQRHLDTLTRARKALESSVQDLAASQDELLEKLLADDVDR